MPSQTSSYDANDRQNSDTYDSNGNTKLSTGGTYDYDFENRLITHTSSVTSGFVYDGDGNRVAKTVNGVTTRFLIDTDNPTGYAQVVDEIRDNQVARTYTYGHSLISQRQLVNSQWQVSFYAHDGQGAYAS